MKITKVERSPANGGYYFVVEVTDLDVMNVLGPASSSPEVRNNNIYEKVLDLVEAEIPKRLDRFGMLEL